MKGLITVAGLGLVGYALYEWLYGSASTAVPLVTSAAASAVTAPAPVLSATTRSLMTAWANANGYSGKLLTAWQWGYIYTQVRGSVAPDPHIAFPGYSATNPRLMSLDEWFAGVGSHGVSGLSGFVANNWRGRVSKSLTAGMGSFTPDNYHSRLAKGLTVN
jgi:hypothetical protein